MLSCRWRSTMSCCRLLQDRGTRRTLDHGTNFAGPRPRLEDSPGNSTSHGTPASPPDMYTHCSNVAFLAEQDCFLKLTIGLKFNLHKTVKLSLRHFQWLFEYGLWLSAGHKISQVAALGLQHLHRRYTLFDFLTTTVGPHTWHFFCVRAFWLKMYYEKKKHNRTSGIVFHN